jgi:hypothetical protein
VRYRDSEAEPQVARYAGFELQPSLTLLCKVYYFVLQSYTKVQLRVLRTEGSLRHITPALVLAMLAIAAFTTALALFFVWVATEGRTFPLQSISIAIVLGVAFGLPLGRTFRDAMNRVVAGLVTAGIVGVAGGLILETSGFEDFKDLNDLLPVSIFVGALYGSALGAPSAIAAMLCTRARVRPWGAVPLLALGGAVGLFAGWKLPVHDPTFLSLVIPATVGGFVATRFLSPRQK